MDLKGKCSCNLKCVKRIWSKNKIVFISLLGVLVGGIVGTVLRPYHIPEDLKVWIKIWGELYIRILKMLILPLIMCSIIIGISSMDVKSGGRLGIVTILYHLIANVLSIILGIIMSLTIRPGAFWLRGNSAKSQINTLTTTNETDTTLPNVDENVNYSDMLADFLRNLFPDNIFRACIENVYTERTYSIESTNETSSTYSTAKLMHRDGTNTMGIIVFSIIMGLAMSATKSETEALKNMLEGLLKCIFLVLKATIWFTPIAIASLVISAVIDIEDISSVIGAIGLYILTFVLCFAIQMFGLIPLLYFIVVRKNPYPFWFRNVFPGVLAGFGPPTSAVGIPVIMETYQENKCVDPRVSDFFLPLAMSVSRSGSAMYIMCTLLFVAQTYPAGITGANIVVAVLMINLLSAAISFVPSASVILLLTVSQAVNVNVGGRLAIIMALDWLMDRLRACNNISSSGLGCIIVEKICIKHLNKKSEIEDPIEKNCADMSLPDDNLLTTNI